MIKESLASRIQLLEYGPSSPAGYVRTLQQMKERRQKITMLTAYDFSTARLLDQAGIDCLLVGDSLGMVVQGMKTTVR